MQEKKRDIYNIAEKRGGTLTVNEDENENKQKFDWKQTRYRGNSNSELVRSSVGKIMSL